MMRNDIDLCHPNPKSSTKVLFNKHIFNSAEEAQNALKRKNLAPGELAVARFYMYPENGYYYNDDKSDVPVRMILGIGGAIPGCSNDIYFFYDGEYKSESDIDLSSYYTKDEIDNLLLSINQTITNIEDTYITTEAADMKFATNEYVENTYVTQEFVTDYVEKEVSTTVVEIIQTDEAINDAITEKVNEVVSQEVVTKENFSTVIQEYYASDDGGDYDGGEEEEWDL